MWTSIVQTFNIMTSDQILLSKLRSLVPINWTIAETLTLTDEQKSICILRKNGFTYHEIRLLTKISSPNTISAIIKYTACGIPFYLGRQGGSYSIYSSTVCHALKRRVHFRTNALNCLRTNEAKQIILEEIEDVKKRALKRLEEQAKMDG